EWAGELSKNGDLPNQGIKAWFKGVIHNRDDSIREEREGIANQLIDLYAARYAIKSGGNVESLIGVKQQLNDERSIISEGGVSLSKLKLQSIDQLLSDNSYAKLIDLGDKTERLTKNYNYILEMGTKEFFDNHIGMESREEIRDQYLAFKKSFNKEKESVSNAIVALKSNPEITKNKQLSAHVQMLGGVVQQMGEFSTTDIPGVYSALPTHLKHPLRQAGDKVENVTKSGLYQLGSVASAGVDVLVVAPILAPLDWAKAKLGGDPYHFRGKWFDRTAQSLAQREDIATGKKQISNLEFTVDTASLLLILSGIGGIEATALQTGKQVGVTAVKTGLRARISQQAAKFIPQTLHSQAGSTTLFGYVARAIVSPTTRRIAVSEAITWGIPNTVSMVNHYKETGDLGDTLENGWVGGSPISGANIALFAAGLTGPMGLRIASGNPIKYIPNFITKNSVARAAVGNAFMWGQTHAVVVATVDSLLGGGKELIARDVFSSWFNGAKWGAAFGAGMSVLGMSFNPAFLKGAIEYKTINVFGRGINALGRGLNKLYNPAAATTFRRTLLQSAAWTATPPVLYNLYTLTFDEKFASWDTNIKLAALGGGARFLRGSNRVSKFLRAEEKIAASWGAKIGRHAVIFSGGGLTNVAVDSLSLNKTKDGNLSNFDMVSGSSYGKYFMSFVKGGIWTETMRFLTTPKGVKFMESSGRRLRNYSRSEAELRELNIESTRGLIKLKPTGKFEAGSLQVMRDSLSGAVKWPVVTGVMELASPVWDTGIGVIEHGFDKLIGNIGVLVSDGQKWQDLKNRPWRFKIGDELVWLRSKSFDEKGSLVYQPLNWSDYIFGIKESRKEGLVGEHSVIANIFRAPESGLYMGPLLKVAIREPQPTGLTTRLGRSRGLAGQFTFLPTRTVARAAGYLGKKEKVTGLINFLEKTHIEPWFSARFASYAKRGGIRKFLAGIGEGMLALGQEAVSLVDVALFVEGVDRGLQAPGRIAACLDGNTKSLLNDDFSKYSAVNFSERGRSVLGWAFLFFKPNYVLSRDTKLLQLVSNKTQKGELVKDKKGRLVFDAAKFLELAEYVDSQGGLPQALNNVFAKERRGIERGTESDYATFREEIGDIQASTEQIAAQGLRATLPERHGLEVLKGKDLLLQQAFGDMQEVGLLSLSKNSTYDILNAQAKGEHVAEVVFDSKISFAKGEENITVKQVSVSEYAPRALSAVKENLRMSEAVKSLSDPESLKDKEVKVVISEFIDKKLQEHGKSLPEKAKEEIAAGFAADFRRFKDAMEEACGETKGHFFQKYSQAWKSYFEGKSAPEVFKAFKEAEGALESTAKDHAKIVRKAADPSAALTDKVLEYGMRLENFENNETEFSSRYYASVWDNLKVEKEEIKGLKDKLKNREGEVEIKIKGGRNLLKLNAGVMRTIFLDKINIVNIKIRDEISNLADRIANTDTKDLDKVINQASFNSINESHVNRMKILEKISRGLEEGLILINEKGKMSYPVKENKADKEIVNFRDRFNESQKNWKGFNLDNVKDFLTGKNKNDAALLGEVLGAVLVGKIRQGLEHGEAFNPKKAKDQIMMINGLFQEKSVNLGTGRGKSIAAFAELVLQAFSGAEVKPNGEIKYNSNLVLIEPSNSVTEKYKSYKDIAEKFGLSIRPVSDDLGDSLVNEGGMRPHSAGFKEKASLFSSERKGEIVLIDINNFGHFFHEADLSLRNAVRNQIDVVRFDEIDKYFRNNTTYITAKDNNKKPSPVILKEMEMALADSGLTGLFKEGLGVLNSNSLGIKINEVGKDNISAGQAYRQTVENKNPAIYFNRRTKQYALNKKAIDKLEEVGLKPFVFEALMKTETFERGKDYGLKDKIIYPMEESAIAVNKVFNSEYLVVALALKERAKGEEVDFKNLKISDTSSQATLSEILKINARSIAGFSGSLENIKFIVDFGIGRGVVSLGSTPLENVRVIEINKQGKLNTIIKEIDQNFGVNGKNENILLIVDSPLLRGRLEKELKAKFDGKVKVVNPEREGAEAVDRERKKISWDSSKEKKVVIGSVDRLGRNIDFKGNFGVFIADAERLSSSDIIQIAGRLRKKGERVLFVDKSEFDVLTDSAKKEVWKKHRFRPGKEKITVKDESGNEVINAILKEGADRKLAKQVFRNAVELDAANKDKATLFEIYERGLSTVDTFFKDLSLQVDKVNKIARSKKINLSGELKDLQKNYERFIDTKDAKSYEQMRISESSRSPDKRIEDNIRQLIAKTEPHLTEAKRILIRIKDRVDTKEGDIFDLLGYGLIASRINKIDTHLKAFRRVGDNYDIVVKEAEGSKNKNKEQEKPSADETIEAVLKDTVKKGLRRHVLTEDVKTSNINPDSEVVMVVEREINEARSEKGMPLISDRDRTEIVKSLQGLKDINGIRGSPKEVVGRLGFLKSLFPQDSPLTASLQEVIAEVNSLSGPGQFNIANLTNIQTAVDNFLNTHSNTESSSVSDSQVSYDVKSRKDIVDVVLSLIDPQFNYSNLRTALSVYEYLPLNLQKELKTSREDFNELIFHPSDFLKSVAYWNRDNYQASQWHLDFLNSVDSSAQTELDESSDLTTHIENVKTQFHGYVTDLEDAADFQEKMEINKRFSAKLKSEFASLDAPLAFSLANIAVTEDRFVREKLNNIEDKLEDPGKEDKEFLQAVSNFTDYSLFLENVLSGEDIYEIMAQVKEEIEPQLEKLSYAVKSELNKEEIEIAEKQAQRKLKGLLPDDAFKQRERIRKVILKLLEIDNSRKQTEKERARNFTQKLRNFKNRLADNKEGLALVAELKQLTDIDITKNKDADLKKVTEIFYALENLNGIEDLRQEKYADVANDLKDALAKFKSNIEDRNLGKETENLLIEKYFSTYQYMAKLIRELTDQLLKESPDNLKTAQAIIENKKIMGKLESHDDYIVDEDGLLQVRPIVEKLIAFNTAALLMKQNTLKEGEFYTPWHRAEMLRRLSHGYINLPDELFIAWFTQEPAAELKKVLFKGENTPEERTIFNRIHKNIIWVLKEKYGQNDKIDEITRRLSQASSLKELMEIAQQLKIEGKQKKSGESGGKIKPGEVLIRFCLPGEMEKQALVSHSDYGMADINFEGSQNENYEIRLDLRLLQTEEGKPIDWRSSQWRSNLINVVLPHEITHVVMDAVSEKVGIIDLKIGSYANEGVIDEVTSHDGLGRLTPYTRVPFSSNNSNNPDSSQTAGSRQVQEVKNNDKQEQAVGGNDYKAGTVFDSEKRGASISEEKGPGPISSAKKDGSTSSPLTQAAMDNISPLVKYQQARKEFAKLSREAREAAEAGRPVDTEKLIEAKIKLDNLAEEVNPTATSAEDNRVGAAIRIGSSPVEEQATSLLPIYRRAKKAEKASSAVATPVKEKGLPWQLPPLLPQALPLALPGVPQPTSSPLLLIFGSNKVIKAIEDFVCSSALAISPIGQAEIDAVSSSAYRKTTDASGKTAGPINTVSSA
ncbi:MAG: hypothetical protein HQ579_04030, partial [Candidatus Omnitrophica bacterium]|nr:hypothetical protein [Candidatus Omnitrophota bacterium]